VKYALLAGAALATLAAALLVGPANLPLADLRDSPIVWQLRLPRAVLAFLVGGALGVAGTSLQALVRNPLADPFLLGLSGGGTLNKVLLVIAIAFGTINVVGGFLVTDRMLEMFKGRKPAKQEEIEAQEEEEKAA